MTKKQWEKFLRTLPENPTLNDIGFVGWQDSLMSRKEEKIADQALAEIIRKHWEEKEKRNMQLTESTYR